MKKRAVWSMVAILFLATITHFNDIETRSLWADEGWTLLLAAGDTPAKIVQTLAYDQHSPLYFLGIHYWIDATGNSEFAIRAFSAFWGILSVAAIYQVGRLSFGGSVGLMAAGLLAIWDFSIDLSQDARQYSILLFLSLLSTAYFLRYLKTETRSHGIGWFIVSVLALYTQYMFGVVLILQLLYALFVVRPLPRLIDVVIRWGLICAAFLPWFPVFIRQNQVRWDDPLFYQSGLPNTEATFILMRDALLTQQFGLVLGLLMVGLVTLRYTPQFNLQSPPPQAIWYGVWAVGYVGLIVFLNEQREILRLRIFILALPPILLLIARGLSNLQQVPQVFLLTILIGVNLLTVDSYQTKPPWREVTQQVTERHQQSEPVLMDIWVGDFPTRYYIEQQMGNDTPWLSIREFKREQGDLFLPSLQAYLQAQDAFWLIRWNDDFDPYDDLLVSMGFQRTASPYQLHEGNRLYAHRYDRLTDETIAVFGESVTLLKQNTHLEGQSLTVSLWWVAQESLPVDYSISVFVYDADDNLIAQNDAPPLTPTTTWQPDQIQFDQHMLTIPPIPNGDYQIGVRVYWYVEPDNPLAVNDSDFVTIGSISIE